MLTAHFRVLFVTNSLSGGGAERTTNILVNALNHAGVNVALATINSGPQDLIIPECPVFEFNRPLRAGVFSVINSYLNLQKVIRIWKPSIIVLNCALPELLGSLSLGSYRLIVVEHSTTPWMLRRNLGKVVRQVLKLRKSIWVAVSDHLAIWGVKDKPNYVIQNPVEHHSAIDKNLTGRISRLVFTGRLSVEKQPNWVISIAKLTQLSVLFVGDGLLKVPLALQGKEDSVSIDFSGFIADPWKLIEDGDLLIVPSAFEGDGLVVVEALIRKVPVLLNDISDFRRFNLPEINYCDGVGEFVSRILEFQKESKEFVVDSKEVARIVANRTPSHAAYLWMRLFSTVK